MRAVFDMSQQVAAGLDRAAARVLTTLTRLVFALVLLVYYWNSGLTKLGDGVLGLVRPSVGAYAQIFPRRMESVGYDISQLGAVDHLVVLAGTWAELILPALIVLGCLTRLAAVGMIGFILVQSATDIWGLGVGAEDVGRWFDRTAGAAILDQRAFWIVTLLVPVTMGGGPLSLDRLLFRSGPSARPAFRQQ
ncbi:DoxX family protein [Pelagovum pacificum]|uniref:DoxX family protein n=1 Tax=Pelagovum pacificum TaxID=2588711 RepID=A0A5C5G8M3_9RHOB|nr:DoxX family protein [Pelagovum pacificum]QQA41622.1 DoxX family protein [Pelagovum pacificum]TNY30901.1 DoxX family protein [Pelagovum pacificum]